MSLSLAELSIKLAQITLRVIIVLGVIGNILNVLILTRPILRHHACSHYFLALASNNLIYSSFLISFLLANGYNMDGQRVSNASCKILHYLGSACPFLSPFFIVCASIDRYLAIPSNAKLRCLSNAWVARWSISLLLLISLLFFINTLVLIELRNDGYGCNLRITTVYNQVFAIVQLVLHAVGPLCFMLTLGILTIYNVNKLQVIAGTTARHRCTESQLLRMLLLQVATYIILNMPLCIIYLMLVLPKGYRPTAELFFAYTIVALPFHFSYATTFFLYILSVRLFREELLKIFDKCGRNRDIIQVQPSSPGNSIRQAGLRNTTI